MDRERILHSVDFEGHRIVKVINEDTGEILMRVFRIQESHVEEFQNVDFMGPVVAEWEVIA